MARIDAIVLGAGIVGTSIGLHLAKRGLAVALVDRRGPGEETSYGNAGVIEGNTLLPHPFPSSLLAVLRVAAKQATEANYHLSFLPRVARVARARRCAPIGRRAPRSARSWASTRGRNCNGSRRRSWLVTRPSTSHARAVAAQPRRRRGRGSVGNLPVPISSFVGRVEEIDTVAELLREHRLVTLVGPGGVGKTRLAPAGGRRGWPGSTLTVSG